MSTSICSRVHFHSIEWSIWRWGRRWGRRCRTVHSLVCRSAENGNRVVVPRANYSMLPGHRTVIVRTGCLHKMLGASLLWCLHRQQCGNDGRGKETEKEKRKSNPFSSPDFSQVHVHRRSPLCFLFAISNFEMQNVTQQLSYLLFLSLYYVFSTVQRRLLLFWMWGERLLLAADHICTTERYPFPREALNECHLQWQKQSVFAWMGGRKARVMCSNVCNLPSSKLKSEPRNAGWQIKIKLMQFTWCTAVHIVVHRFPIAKRCA